MIGKKINQLATELAPVSTDLTIIGDPISGVSKKITLAQLGAIFSGAVSFYTDLASFPATGDINVIYCAKDTQKLYLWSGSAYVEVFPSQALLDTYQLRSEKGNANGYASLDSGGKVPISQLPSSIMEYKGTWNAATNTPTLANGTGDTGDVYICNVAGTVNFGAGPITFAVGDYVIYSGTIWQRSSGAVGTVTSVAATITGDSVTISGSPVTTSGTLAFAFNGTTAQYIRGNGTLETFPSLTGFVPYTGATANVDLGTFDLTADVITGATGSYTSSGGGNTLEVTHSSGSGIALNITKGGNGEGLYINKTSGTGNAATIIGTLNATTLVKSGGTSSQFLKADGSVDSNTYYLDSNPNAYIPLTALSAGAGISYNNTTGVITSTITQYTDALARASISLTTSGTSGAATYNSTTGVLNVPQYAPDLSGYVPTSRTLTINGTAYDLSTNRSWSVGTVTSIGLSSATSGVTIGSTPITTSGTITLAIATASGSQQGLLSSTDWTTFNNKQSALTNPVTGTGTTNYLPKFTGTSTIGNSLINDDGTTIQATRTAGDLEFGLTAGNTTTAGNPSIALYSNTGAGNLVPYGTIKVSPDAAGNTRAAKMVFGVRQSGGSLLDALTINSSGNLGLGVTPSAWSVVTGLQVLNANVSSVGGNTNNSNFGSNFYYDGTNFRYIGTSFATNLKQLNGGFEFYTAPSGTAGNAISFTQAMTLDASGRLLIGGTSTYDFNDAAKLVVANTSGNSTIIIASGTSSSGYLAFADGTSGTDRYTGNIEYNHASNYMAFKVNAGAEVLRLASTGAATFSSSVTAGADINLESNESYLNLFSTYSVGMNARARIRAVGAGGGSGYGGDFRVSTRATNNVWNNDVFVVNSSGNVGIGTTSPQQKLDVFGISRISSTTPTQEFFTTVNGDVWATIQAVAGTGSGGSLSIGTKRNGDSVTEKLRILDNGNVGIGTTSPGSVYSELLQVSKADLGRINVTHTNNSGGRQSDILFTEGTSLQFQVGTILGSGTFSDQVWLRGVSNIPMVLYTNDTERMRITSGGNVEINTGSIKTGEPDTGWGRAAIKIGQRQSGEAFSSGGYLPVNVDGTVYYINLYSSTP